MKYKIPAEFKIMRVRECAALPAPCDTPTMALEYWRNSIEHADWFSQEREHLVTILLNARLRCIGHHLISIGSVAETHCHPRECLRPAIVHSAYAIMLMHNHPSGDASPSAADHRVTIAIRDAARLMQISLIDHVIVGNSLYGCPYYSFREAGIL